MNFLEQLAMEAGIVAPETGYNGIDVAELIIDNVQGLSNEAARTVALMDALQNNFDYHIAGKETVSFESYGAYIAASESIIMACGIDLPVGIVAPAFESAEDISLEAEATKDNFAKAAIKWIWAQLQRIGEWFKTQWQKLRGTAEQQTEELKKEVVEVKAAEKKVEEVVAAAPAEKKEEVKAQVVEIGKVSTKHKVPAALMKGKVLDKSFITGQFLPYVEEAVKLLAEAENKNVDTAAFTKKHQALLARLSKGGEVEVSMDLKESVEFAEAVTAATSKIGPQLKGQMDKLQTRLSAMTKEAEGLSHDIKSTTAFVRGQTPEVRRDIHAQRGTAEAKTRHAELTESIKVLNASLQSATRMYSLFNTIRGIAKKQLILYKAKLTAVKVAA